MIKDGAARCSEDYAQLTHSYQNFWLNHPLAGGQRHTDLCTPIANLRQLIKFCQSSLQTHSQTSQKINDIHQNILKIRNNLLVPLQRTQKMHILIHIRAFSLT
jgi:hypothetical protein